MRATSVGFAFASLRLIVQVFALPGNRIAAWWKGCGAARSLQRLAWIHPATHARAFDLPLRARDESRDNTLAQLRNAAATFDYRAAGHSGTIPSFFVLIVTEVPPSLEGLLTVSSAWRVSVLPFESVTVHQ